MVVWLKIGDRIMQTDKEPIEFNEAVEEKIWTFNFE